jgi:biopolymer transport protein TolR
MGAKVGGGSHKGGMDEINVTPLIDVVLVLLIIFMVLTPITVRQMASNLPPVDPPEQPDPPDTPPDQLLVAVYQDGTVALNLKVESDDELGKEIEARLRGKEKKTVFIDAHPDANYGRVMQVMDMVRDRGADKVGFTDMDEDGPAKLDPGAVLPVPGAPALVPPAPPTP